MKLLPFLKESFGIAFSEETPFPLRLTPGAFKKDDIITDYGQTERKLYFINEGFVELSMLHDGEENIIEFFFQDSFVCAYTSFLRQKPSDVRITALSHCEMEVIYYNDLQHAYKTSFVANVLGRMLTEEIYIAKTKREKDFLTKPAAERYRELMLHRPEVLQLVPINKIARYLGIHPESLSRIRRSLIS